MANMAVTALSDLSYDQLEDHYWSLQESFDEACTTLSKLRRKLGRRRTAELDRAERRVDQLEHELGLVATALADELYG
ncbi:hypothetical protein J5500_00955 [Candidatus Saccharibacteria bacterium]|nr:hypothetical protein [Candidatus Saccharibacteria bacterium]